MTTRQKRIWQATLNVCIGGFFVWSCGLASLYVIG